MAALVAGAVAAAAAVADGSEQVSGVVTKNGCCVFSILMLGKDAGERSEL